MIILYPAGVKREWYDRNPVDKTQDYLANGVSPAVTTDRLTYTVPAGKRAFLSSAYLFMNRATVATAALRAWIAVRVDDLSTVAVVCELIEIQNVINQYKTTAVMLGVFLTAGQKVYVSTFDGSTGGTYDFEGSFIINEFDA